MYVQHVCFQCTKDVQFWPRCFPGFLPGRARGRGRGHKGSQKHWHNIGTEDMDTAVDIEHVDMKARRKSIELIAGN
ncbi:hypothetical protein DPMN_022121 [Dreissena polymorpha]|uniref:Uncharacterized protein n=1 Tax=Dreissena polymorpha TaxID=45954 RepID=A0A9D4NNW1_DREPO|nr:hypothetical protein DPMN_022121 [Dreissena polymorpha]